MSGDSPKTIAVQPLVSSKPPCRLALGCDICPEYSECVLQRREEHEHWLVGQRLAQMRHRIMITSGKGGVGKSTLCANLAVALARKGQRVALIDADIHGPNIPHMLVPVGSPRHQEGKGLQLDEVGIIPVQPLPEAAPGLGIISMDYFIQSSDEAVMWKGPLKKDLIRQLIASVNWGPRDFLLFDLPPGTGDEPMMITEVLDRVDGALVVSTPQRVALLDARKSISMANHLQVPVLGMVENMSDPELFGSGQVAADAAELGVPFLGEIPMDKRIIRLADEGVSIVNSAPDSPAAQAFEGLADSLLQRFANNGG